MDAGACRQDRTVHDQFLAAHELALIARQEERHPGDVLSLATVGPRLQLGHDLLGLLLVSAVHQRREDEPRADGIHPDPVRCQLQRRRLGEADDCGLGSGVRLRAGAAAHPGNRPRVDDRAAGALRDHDPGGVLGAQHHRAHQDRERLVPGVDFQFRDGSERPADAGIVEHHVQPTERLDRQVGHRSHVVLHRHVGAGEASVIAEAGAGQLLHECTPGVGVEVADHHRGALGQESLHRRPSHAAGPARDHGHLAGQPPLRAAAALIHRAVLPCCRT